jgi:ornithine--oxo-acid transaminase
LSALGNVVYQGGGGAILETAVCEISGLVRFASAGSTLVRRRSARIHAYPQFRAIDPTYSRDLAMKAVELNPRTSRPQQPWDPWDMGALFSAREADRFDLHSRNMNNMMVRVLKTIGFDARFVSGRGAHLMDSSGARYLDLLSGFGVFAIGRNHPRLAEALKSVLDSDLPNLVQMDLSVLAGVLAERLLSYAPWLQKVFFANSGAEAFEAAVKFARAATGRAGIVHCEHAFHGLTYGALSAVGDDIFRGGFGPLLPGFVEIPFDDLPALERALKNRDVAAFCVEPIQGKGVNMPSPDYLRNAHRLCKKYGTLFVADEIQTGLGRTGRFFAVEHWGIEPDMILLAKGLSGGHVPVGAVLLQERVFARVFDRMDKAVVHGSTFAKNDLAMAGGIATLEVLESERLVENAAAQGGRLLSSFEGMKSRYELIKDVRGKGLMIGVELGEPRSLKLRASWELLERMNKGLFCQLVTIPLFREHKILVQVAGHASRTIKLLPALLVDAKDCDWIEKAFDAVIAESHNVAGPLWSLGKTLVEGARSAARVG